MTEIYVPKDILDSILEEKQDCMDRGDLVFTDGKRRLSVAPRQATHRLYLLMTCF